MEDKMIQLIFDENGIAHKYDDTYDITIHCESLEENERVMNILNAYVKDDAISKKYIISVLSDLLNEYSELDENGLHDPKWCGIKESYLVVTNAPSVKESV